MPGKIVNRGFLMVKRDSHFKHFVKKHERWLTFTGAFIVFMTFVVKDGLGDRWAHLAEAVDAAEYAYSIHIDMKELNTAVLRKLHLIDNQQTMIADNISKDKQLATMKSFNYELIVELDDELTRIKASHADLVIIVDKLPGHRYGNILSDFETAEKKLSSEAEYLTARYPDSTNEIVNVVPPPPWKYVSKYEQKQFRTPMLADNPHEQFTRTMELNDSIEYLQFDMDTLTKQVLSDAEIVRKENEVRSSYAWWITVALFAIGWTLGLVGKLYGVPEAPGGD
jgi:hypothetical protein